jgi:hypothetical protein
MMLDPQLLQRILRSLRWLVADAEHRFNDCKGNANGFEGGYSPELKEAIRLKNDLEQGQLPLQTTALVAPMHTEADCHETGALLGMNSRSIIEFYLQYSPQWVRGYNNKPMVNLLEEMRRWELNQGERDKAGQQRRHLFPLAGGKICSERGCGMPAVLKVSGAYDFWYCPDHIPENRKVKLREQGYDV